ncbi:MAG: hypothetical protein IIA10_11405 [Proteobacteria bacterium]|nr:hypothetical protein [Pseudomonadota bacterium]
MRAFRLTVACIVFSISSVSLGAHSDGIFLSHYEPLQRLTIQTGIGEFDQKLQAAGPVNLSFDALGRSFDIQLEPNTRLLPAESRAVLAGGVTPYRGQLTGKPGSWARIVIAGGMPRGLIWDGEQLFAIEAPGDSLVSSPSPIIYRLADAVIAPGTMSCGTSVAFGSNGAAMYQSLVAELNIAMAQGAGAVSEINFGAIGDFEFTSAQGGDANANTAILTRLNNVDGIYSQQLGVQINVPVVETFATAADPFSDVTDPSDFLIEVAAYRRGTAAQNSQGLTHMFTGRNLDGSTVGIAYSSALCSRNFGAGLTQGTGGAAFDSLVAAHEIGHNFGAPHDGEAGSACEAEPSTFLMATTLNGNDQFSACSIVEMQDDIAAASCITQLPGVDIRIALSGQPPTVLLGNSATVTFDVTNNGTEPSVNTITTVTLPGNVSFVSSGASMGLCTDGAGTVTCVLGDVAGGSGATVTVSTITTAVGTGTFNAAVVADVDDDITNNQDSVLLTVDPAVNLTVTPQASTQINVDQSTTVAVALANLSILDATGVTISVILGVGLQPDTASWSIGTCSIAGQQIDCQASLFAAQSSSTLSIGVTGLTSGAKNYTTTLSSNEVDADPSNNTATGTVNVNTPSSGGGAMNMIFLWLLGLLAISRKNRGRAAAIRRVLPAPYSSVSPQPVEPG